MIIDIDDYYSSFKNMEWLIFCFGSYFVSESGFKSVRLVFVPSIYKSNILSVRSQVIAVIAVNLSACGSQFLW